MSLCLSSLAYSKETESDTFETMKECGIKHVETVFSKIKPWILLHEDDVYAYKNKLEKRRIYSRSAQSLFYGMDFNLNDVDATLEHFETLIKYAKIVGIKTLVFGSPGMRKMRVNYKENLTTIFKVLDTMLIDTGITVAIEPNARVYGGDFWHTVPEICMFLEDKYLRRIRTMVDYHNSILEDRDPCEDLLLYKKYISHIHVSEPKLGPIQDLEMHSKFSIAIKQAGYMDFITYEILEFPGITDSIKEFSRIYS